MPPAKGIAEWQKEKLQLRKEAEARCCFPSPSTLPSGGSPRPAYNAPRQMMLRPKRTVPWQSHSRSSTSTQGTGRHKLLNCTGTPQRHAIVKAAPKRCHQMVRRGLVITFP